MLGTLTGSQEILNFLTEHDPGGSWNPASLMNAAGDARTNIPMTREAAVLIAKRSALGKWVQTYVSRGVAEGADLAWPALGDPLHADEEPAMLRSRSNIEHFCARACPRALDALRERAGHSDCPVSIQGREWAVSPAALRPWLKARAVEAVREIARDFDPLRHRPPAVSPNEIQLFNALRRELALR